LPPRTARQCCSPRGLLPLSDSWSSPSLIA